MRLWLDCHLSPKTSEWLNESFGVQAESLIQKQMFRTTDREIFRQAGEIGAVLMTKDEDFLKILAEKGVPPKILFLTCGKTSNSELRRILSIALPRALEALAGGEILVEICTVSSSNPPATDLNNP